MLRFAVHVKCSIHGFNLNYIKPAGSGQEAGLLPRALVSLFRKLQGRLYGAVDLKPVMYQDVRQLDPSEVKEEEIRRNSLLKEVNKRKTLILKVLHN